MLFGRRIRVALIALLVLAVVGWFAQQALGVDHSDSPTGSLPNAEPGRGFAWASGPAPDLAPVGVPDDRAAPRAVLTKACTTHGARKTLLSHTPTGSDRINDLTSGTVETLV